MYKRQRKHELFVYLLILRPYAYRADGVGQRLSVTKGRRMNVRNERARLIYAPSRVAPQEFF